MTYRTLLFLLGLGLPLTLGGCGAPTDDDDDSVSGDDDDSASGDDDDDDDTVNSSISVTGRVLDPDGLPAASTMLTFCHETCLNAPTDDDGYFIFADFPAGTYVLENIGVPDGDLYGWSRFFEFVTVADGEHLELGDFVIPQISGSSGLTGPQAYSDGALSVSFDADAVTLPFGLSEGVGFGTAELPQAWWPSGGHDNWEIVKAWAVAPWDQRGDAVFDVSVTLDAPNVGGLMSFLVADYEEGISTGEFAWYPADVSDDGLTVSTPAGAGLNRATLILLVEGIL